MWTIIKKTWFYGWWLVRFSIKMSISIVIAFFAKMTGYYKDLWLIMELPKEARDNGYWLYKHIVEEHPETNVRYVLAKDSPDYEKMSDKSRIIKPYSWKHYIAYILCSRSVSTHIYGASPGRYYAKLFLRFMPKKEEVFLQHGVTKEIIPLRGYSGWTMSVSKTETEHFVKSGHKNPEMIIQAGFCRFDSLIDESDEQKEKIILIMPTFRSWLGGNTLVNKKVFLASDFYKSWQSVLNNKKLKELVNDEKYKVIFYPHRQMQGFAHLFNVGEGFEVATKVDYDIQELLRKASVLITDYSSVLFDFSYMKKPVIFYAFDQKEFYSSHHKHSGRPDPFGEYAKNEKSLIKTIHKYANSNFTISKKASKEVDSFFVFTDKNNCERNFTTIESLGR